MQDDPGKARKGDELSHRHHTVTKHYLRRWAKDDQLVRVPLDKAPHPIAATNATVIRDFYNHQDADGAESDAFEKAFSQLEATAKPAFEEVVEEQRWPIPSEARAGIAAWSALQHLRTEAQRNAQNEVADVLFKAQLAVGGRAQLRTWLEDATGTSLTTAELDATWSSLTDFDSYEIRPSPPAALHLQTIAESLDRTTEIFFDRGWTLVRFERKAVVTCDTPVVLVRDPNRSPHLGTGLATAGAIIVPIDRRVALMMGRKNGPDTREPGTAAFAWDINQRLANSTRRALYHHPDDQPLTRITLPAPRDHELLLPDLEPYLRDPA